MPEKISIDSKANQWLAFVGAVLLVAGIYGGIRTIINFAAFDKYPVGSVLPLGDVNIFGALSYQNETECYYTPTFTDSQDNPRQATEAEVSQAKTDESRCLDQVAAARQKAKVDDSTKSVLLIGLGLALIKGRRLIFN